MVDITKLTRNLAIDAVMDRIPDLVKAGKTRAIQLENAIIEGKTTQDGTARGRIIDGALQKLRKAGKLGFVKGEGWIIVGAPLTYEQQHEKWDDEEEEIAAERQD